MLLLLRALETAATSLGAATDPLAVHTAYSRLNATREVTYKAIADLERRLCLVQSAAVRF